MLQCSVDNICYSVMVNLWHIAVLMPSHYCNCNMLQKYYNAVYISIVTLSCFIYSIVVLLQ